MKSNIVFLSIGSNQGDRCRNIKECLGLIEKQIGVLELISSIYITEPWGFMDQSNFLNLVIKVKTSFSANSILEKAQHIESNLGRKRTAQQFSSRTIDVDILFYNNDQINLNHLLVPHPRLHLRRFVLDPLNEIASDFIHPIFGKKVSTLLNECKDHSAIKILKQIEV